MKQEDAFAFMDSLFIEKRMTHLSWNNIYRILMDVHDISRDEAYKHYRAWVDSGRAGEVAKIIGVNNE
jgi:hypothetical protein